MHFSRLTLLQLAAQILLRIRPETSMTDAPILSVGDGAVYEVLHLGTCEDTEEAIKHVTQMSRIRWVPQTVPRLKHALA